MDQGIWLLSALIISVLFIILGTSKFKIHPFIVLLIASYGVGFIAGMPASGIVQVITQGFGNILAYIGIVIILGTIIGTILEKSGGSYKNGRYGIEGDWQKTPHPGNGVYWLYRFYPCVLRLSICDLIFPEKVVDQKNRETGHCHEYCPGNRIIRHAYVCPTYPRANCRSRELRYR